jgi:hypothetical protein
MALVRLCGHGCPERARLAVRTADSVALALDRARPCRGRSVRAPCLCRYRAGTGCPSPSPSAPAAGSPWRWTERRPLSRVAKPSTVPVLLLVRAELPGACPSPSAPLRGRPGAGHSAGPIAVDESRAPWPVPLSYRPDAGSVPVAVRTSSGVALALPVPAIATVATAMALEHLPDD